MEEALIKKDTANELADGIKGKVLLPLDDGYEASRKVWNGMIDRKPEIIVRCAGASDVISSVHFARAHDLIVAVRGGGHNAAGNAVCEGGLVVDLSQMKGFEIDLKESTARAESGMTWGEFDQETQVFGLATTGGVVSTTGIAGLTLGGGIGRLGRKYGLACDNLLSADIVVADGRMLRVSEAENPDLFWGIRGGGGNFGIVTSFKYQLHRVGPIVLAGSVTYAFENAKDVLKFYYNYSRDAPDELCTDLLILTPDDGIPVININVCYVGEREEGERILRPLRESGSPLEDSIQPVEYTVLQSSGDYVYPPGPRYYWKSHFMKDISDDAIDCIIEFYKVVPSKQTTVGFQQFPGAVSRIKQGDTAFSHRDSQYDFFLISSWVDRAESDKHILWTREFWDAMRSYSTGGVYVNNLGEEPDQQVRAAYPGNYERLVALKNKYDPTNFFRLNQNIKPTV